MKTKNITNPMWTKSDMYEAIERRYATNSFLQPEISAQWEELEKWHQGFIMQRSQKYRWKKWIESRQYWLDWKADMERRHK